MSEPGSTVYTRRTVVTGMGATAAVIAAGAAVSGCEVSRAEAGPPPGTRLGRTGDIPVGGGQVYPEAGVVVVQPEAGTFKAYTAKCTHRGCLVTEVSDGTILCPCHVSRFAVVDGSVTEGPADQPLTECDLTVIGDQISVA